MWHDILNILKILQLTVSIIFFIVGKKVMIMKIIRKLIDVAKDIWYLITRIKKKETITIFEDENSDSSDKKLPPPPNTRGR